MAETLFVTDFPDLVAKVEPVWAVRSEAYGVAFPEVTQTCVQFAALVYPELVIEIKCVAHVRSSGPVVGLLQPCDVRS